MHTCSANKQMALAAVEFEIWAGVGCGVECDYICNVMQVF